MTDPVIDTSPKAFHWRYLNAHSRRKQDAVPSQSPMANRRRGPAPSWEPRSTPAMLLPLDRLQVPDGLAQPHRDLDLATSALTNVATDVDDQDLVSHLNLVPM